MTNPSIKSSEIADPLDALLEEWSDWMHTDCVGEGYPTASAFARLHKSNSVHDTATEILESTVIPWRIGATDASIGDLPQAQRLVIYSEWLNTNIAAFRYQRIPAIGTPFYEALYSAAKGTLRLKLNVKGIFC